MNCDKCKTCFKARSDLKGTWISMEDKKITNTAKWLIRIWNIGLFIVVWFAYYNRLTYDMHWLEGGIASCIAYVVIYSWFCNTYHVFRLASSSVSDSIFGQVVAIGVSDLLLYLESCVSSHSIINVYPGLFVAVLQILGSALIVSGIKSYFVKHLSPQKMFMIYGKSIEREEAQNFCSLLEKKYPYIFQFVYLIQEEMPKEEFYSALEECDSVMLYEISHGLRGKYMKTCTEHKKGFYFTPRIEDIFCQGSEEKNLTDTPLLKYKYVYEMKSGYFGKRLFDLVLSALFLVLLSPVFVITAVCIKLEDGGPVFYKQKRCTKNGREFEILKFRSMVVNAEENGAMPCTDHDVRVTKIGRLIRATRIDELPQIINILKNDMSFVGPRPERVEHIEKYINEMPEFSYRFRVNGGLTGYAQVWGKYNTSAYDKLRYDLMYIENQSFYLDFKILVLTFRTVFKSESTEGFDMTQSTELKQEIKEPKTLLQKMQQ